MQQKAAGTKGMKGLARSDVPFNVDAFECSAGREAEDWELSYRDYEAEFESWMKLVRVGGPFFYQHGRAPRFVTFRRNALVDNSDACNEAAFDRFARYLCNRWMYSESEAREIFGDYFNPLLAADYIYMESIPRRIAKVALGIEGSSSQSVVVVVPTLRLIESLSYYSTRLNFIVGFVVAHIQRTKCERGNERGNFAPPFVCFLADSMLRDQGSALHNALRAPAPPQQELDIIGAFFGLKQTSTTLLRPFAGLRNRPTGQLIAECKRLLPESSANGTVSLVHDANHFRLELVCAPVVLNALLDSLHRDGASVAGNGQMYASHSVVQALGDNEREELMAAIYGAATRGDLEINLDRTLRVACLNKITARLWPTIASSVTRPLVEFVITGAFSRYEHMIGESSGKCCMPMDLFRGARVMFELMATFRQITRLISAFGKAPDREWINIKDAISLLDFSEAVYVELMGSRFEKVEDLPEWCLFAWFCGFVDLAFVVDKKGNKPAIHAFRVNRAALRRAVLPEVAHDEPVSSATDWSPSNRYSSKVEVLPNSEVLCPPDLHPAIKFCLATVLQYVRTNTFSVDFSKGSIHSSLGLIDRDIFDLLSVISRTALPKMVSERLLMQVEGGEQPIHASSPDFVMTGVSQEKARRILKQLGEKRFFALELTNEVWGFFDRHASFSSESLDAFTLESRSRNSRETKTVIKAASKLGVAIETDLAGLTAIGEIPRGIKALCYQRSNLNQPTLEKLSRFCEFFEINPQDPDWENEKIGVQIFSLVPRDVRTTKAFQRALAPCLSLMSTPMDYV